VTGQGEPHLPRLLTTAVAVVVGYVLLVGNPWLSRDIAIVVSDSDSIFRFVNVLFSYPTWYVDTERTGSFLFWFANLRTVFFVVLAVAGLLKMPRWVSSTAGGLGLFVITVGMTTLSALTAGLASALLGVTLVDKDGSLPFIDVYQPEEFFLVQLSVSAWFGVLFGVMLGVLVLTERPAPTSRERRVTAPKSFW
jgi:hypothetical protein